MVKINKVQAPPQLTPQLVQQLTAEFIADKSAVWKKSYIVKALYDSSQGKCCYCECKLLEEGKYLEVEHFLPKDSHSNLVVDWDNLLPGCGRCNKKKSTHDPSTDGMIINPAIINPRDHLRVSLYRIVGKTDLGTRTKEVLNLNDPEKMVKARFDIAEQVNHNIEAYLEQTRDYVADATITDRKWRNLLNRIKYTMSRGLPQNEYSATVSTSIIVNPEFQELQALLQAHGNWDQELADICDGLHSVALL